MLSVFLATAALGDAQQTTSFSGKISVTGFSDVKEVVTTGEGAAGMIPLGFPTMVCQIIQSPDANGNPTGPAQLNMTLTFNTFDTTFNQFDTISLSAHLADPGTSSGIATVTGGTGAYAGASGTLTLNAHNTPASNNDVLTYNYGFGGSGTVTIGGVPTNLEIGNFIIPAESVVPTELISASGSGGLTPFGNVMLSLNGQDLGGDNDVRQLTATISLNSRDSFNIFATFNGPTFVPTGPGTITGGTGAFSGASGTATVTLSSDRSQLTISGTVTQPAAGTPVITAVKTAWGPNAIAPNGWIEIHGTNLVPASTPAGGVFWSNAPEFASGMMPTQLGGISATVNGQPAYVYWFCSAATTTSCADDQINVLSPLNSPLTNFMGGGMVYSAQVPVVVTSGGVSSAPFMVTMRPVVPTFLMFDPMGDTVATHLDGSLVGATTLFPGSSTPALYGETITLWGVGWGPSTVQNVEGSAKQTGQLYQRVLCQIGGMVHIPAQGYLVSPGLYQFNITVPTLAFTGNEPVICRYSAGLTVSGSTFPENLINLQ
jgi:uncharacterized protein (TIGR03437 family)